MLNLKVVTPKKLVMEREVQSVIAPTASGEITVLPKHASLLTLLKEGVITIHGDKSQEYLSIGGGYLETDGKSIHILVSRAFGQDEINEQRTQEAIRKAEAILKETKDQHERDEALASIRRSTIDMKVLSKLRRKRS